ncbi:transcriptional regulator, GntR family [Actinacidiphila yanglinensis]|uniref:Transcriptional regulator, GntR family n=2 Tax=Actinacidiphila yanglinensis TaxID=310779 RepID=A0A1H6C405_9ACTN|nr:transcriptional regulator, GntR family [Actinacidiphila yanglinensis]
MSSFGSPGARPNGLHAQLMDALGRRIAQGDLPVGSVISPEQIGAEYEVSRSVVREALRALEILGMIRPRHKAGTTIQPQATWALLNPQVIAWRADGPDADAQLGELMALREAVEPAAVKITAVHGEAALVTGLHQHLDWMREAYGRRNRATFVEADTAFHRTMLEGAANTVFSQLVQTLLATLHARYSDRRQLFTSDTAASLDRHERVIQAIAARDPEAAAAAALTLVRATGVEVLGTTPSPEQ